MEKENSKFGGVLFLDVEMQKWKVHFYISTFLHPYGDNSKFWQTLSQSRQNCRSKKNLATFFWEMPHQDINSFVSQYDSATPPCHYINVKMESPFLHFYIHMGTSPNFGRHFLNLRRIVEVKKVGNLFLGGATLVNNFFWKSIGVSHPYPLS